MIFSRRQVGGRGVRSYCQEYRIWRSCLTREPRVTHQMLLETMGTVCKAQKCILRVNMTNIRKKIEKIPMIRRTLPRSRV